MHLIKKEGKIEIYRLNREEYLKIVDMLAVLDKALFGEKAEDPLDLSLEASVDDKVYLLAIKDGEIMGYAIGGDSSNYRIEKKGVFFISSLGSFDEETSKLLYSCIVEIAKNMGYTKLGANVLSEKPLRIKMNGSKNYWEFNLTENF